MARAVWSGAISLGLVSIPVRLLPANRRRDLRFRELDRATGQRLRHQRVREQRWQGSWQEGPPGSWEEGAPGSWQEGAPGRWQEGAPGRWQEGAPGGWEEGAPGSWPDQSAAAPPGPAVPAPPMAAEPPREVGAEDVVKGFEVSPGRFVSVERAELEELRPERSRTIDVELFTDQQAVDPIYFDVDYHAVPALDQARSFAVLVDAMLKEKRVAICWVVLRTRRHLAALRPFGDGLLLSTMFYADEILPAPWAGLTGPALTDRERDMAGLLVRTLSGPFEPERYRDEYRERVLAMIEERAGDAVEAPEAAPMVAPANVDDLLAALRASIDQAKAQRAQPRDGRRRQRGA